MKMVNHLMLEEEMLEQEEDDGDGGAGWQLHAYALDGLSRPCFAALKPGHRGYDQALEVNPAGQNLQKYDETSYRTSRALNDYCTFSKIVWKNAGASPIQTVTP